MKNFIITFLLAAILAGCAPSDGGKEQLFSEITYLEQEIAAQPRPSAGALDSLMAKLEDYAGAYPQDSLSVKFLFRVGEMAQLQGQHEKALEIYGQIMQVYDGSDDAAKALFMKGFTLDNGLNRLDEAKAVYEEFLQKYPEDPFADDAGFLLKNLGRSGEEIIKEFEAKQGGN